MFTQLRIKNFKVWKGEHKVELAPLSLFLGTNSAGKTSLLQMLLLLKQTAESPDRRQHLNLGGQPGDVLYVQVSRERRVQFLVETHSENLFRRLQFLIADEHIPPEDCRLYFVKRGDESAELHRLEVDEYGRIRNWPERFFGDAIGEVERQTRRMIERIAKRQRS